MADGNSKVVVNLSTGLEDAERVMVAFLVAGAALEQGKQVAMFLTKEAVRLALPGSRRRRRLRGLPAARTALRAVRERRRRAPRLPDLLQRQQARRGRSSSRTRSSPARRRSGSGSATARRSSATEAY